jgi:vancomycin resistance protein YoaR
MQQPQRQRRSQRHAAQQEEVRRPQYPDDAPRTQYPSGAAYPTYPQENTPAQYTSAPQTQYASARHAQYPEYPDYPVSSPTVQPAQQPYSAPQQGYYPSYGGTQPNAYSQPSAPSYPQYNRRFSQGVPPGTPVYPPAGPADDYDPPAHRRSHDGLWLLIIIVCIALLVLGGLWVSSLYSNHYPAFKEKVSSLNQDTFYYGVHIDGVHIGGMTRAEAKAALTQNAAYTDQQFSLNVTIDGKTWTITQEQLPLSRNIDAVLDEAYAIGRQGMLETLNGSGTPFEARYQQVSSIAQEGAYLYTQITYDKATVRELAQTLSERVSTQAQDATIYQFDFATRSFQFTAEQMGQTIDSEEIYNAIVSRMDARNYSAITLSTVKTAPSVTAAQLNQSFGLISTYSTSTGNLKGYNRTKNIELACAAITGTLESGQTFSFNSTTGRRTVDKGYLPAGAIAQGSSVEEVGGGVCQVSSTLFNAAAMANMEIVYSSPHAWPSTYVDPGRDATVDWQSYQSLSESLDFKFKNSSDYPIYIVAYVTGSNYNKDCKCTVEIYGITFTDGLTIDLKTELVSTTPAPTDVERRLNTELEYGTEKVVRKARDGYVYKTYRVYYQNGVEIRRDLLRTSTYRTYSQIIEYNY